MMPMLRHRKARYMEKLENLCRTATAKNSFPTRVNKSGHACASPWAGATEPERSDTARRKVKT